MAANSALDARRKHPDENAGTESEADRRRPAVQGAGPAAYVSLTNIFGGDLFGNWSTLNRLINVCQLLNMDSGMWCLFLGLESVGAGDVAAVVPRPYTSLTGTAVATALMDGRADRLINVADNVTTQSFRNIYTLQGPACGDPLRGCAKLP